ncbi:hypothetical protein WA026_013372 [Henosepilachna vigintioctopunctata]|uniref:SAM-dependent MTase RsmB/NOP-type domain-containing protein n=1 Tax=Henosepilachna vigintioctopunctata TaxID=420089 RepID=A0AAW1VFV3_9CUCU
MSTKGKFNHSVSVPRIYKIASKVAKNAKTGLSLKNLVYQEKHVNIKAVYALVVETFKREAVIEDLIEKSKLFEKEPRFDPWLAKILICEMLWGKNKMKGDSKPVKTILEYEKLLKIFLSNCTDIKRDILKHNIMKPRYARVNTLKISVEEAVNNFRDEGWTLVKYFNDSDYDGFLEKLSNLESNEFMIDIHIPELLIFPPKTEFYNHEAYKSKMVVLQDKASCLPVFLLNPIPGSTVIDMCAAPGMKTTQVAAMLKNSGTVHAVELDKNREKILRELVEAAGATCVKTILKDVMQISESDCPGVEYILVDPSCTGSGITDRVEIEDQNFHDRMSRLKKLCNFQAKLLRHATTAFPQAKRIVYSTCSINAEENEDVVRQVLETCRNFKLIDAKKLLKSWNDKSSEVFPALGKMCVYATPEKDKTNGFFIAVLERLEEGERNPYLNVQLCKLYDRGKKTKNLNRKENGNENLPDQNSKKVNLHQTNLASTAANVPLQKRRFKKENNFEKIDNMSASHVLSDQIEKNKLQNVSEQDNTKMLKELDKVAPDDTKTLENGHPEENHKNQYNETTKDENKKSLIDCSQIENSKSKKKKKIRCNLIMKT